MIARSPFSTARMGQHQFSRRARRARSAAELLTVVHLLEAARGGRVRRDSSLVRCWTVTSPRTDTSASTLSAVIPMIAVVERAPCTGRAPHPDPFERYEMA